MLHILEVLALQLVKSCIGLKQVRVKRHKGGILGQDVQELNLLLLVKHKLSH